MIDVHFALSRLTDVVDELAGWYPGDREFGHECIFCTGDSYRAPANESLMDEKYHDEDCLWLKAARIARELRES